MIPVVRYNGSALVCCGLIFKNTKSVTCRNKRFSSPLSLCSCADWRILSTQSKQRVNTTSCRQYLGSVRDLSPVFSAAGDLKKPKVDLKLDAINIFKYAVNSVRPLKMIKDVLRYDKSESTLTVEDKVYHLHRNVFIVGFGKATLGMARAVDDILGEHVVSGIISIPRGLPKEMADDGQLDYLLQENTKIQAYEGSFENQLDEAAYNAAKAIKTLVSNLSAKDIVVVLSSGGGSALLPYPHPPITISDLLKTTRLLSHQGASFRDIATVRKNIELLKGGGLVVAAKPAQVLCLTLSSIIGDSVDVMAGGPTYPMQPTPHHALQILERLGVKGKVPTSVITYLDNSIKKIDLIQSNEKTRQAAMKTFESHWNGLQNVIVGNNSLACDAAVLKASSLGYLPLVLTTAFQQEARNLGSISIKLAKFMMLSFFQKTSAEVNKVLACLELDLVGSGLKKHQLNEVTAHAAMAKHLNKDFCIVGGGEMVVNVKGNGVGGKNMECVLAAVSEMRKNLVDHALVSTRVDVAFLSAATDGHDGATHIAGAVVDNDFVAHVREKEYDIDAFLENNDSFTFFQAANGGKSLIDTKLTGTNVMDMIILIIRLPRH